LPFRARCVPPAFAGTNRDPKHPERCADPVEPALGAAQHHRAARVDLGEERVAAGRPVQQDQHAGLQQVQKPPGQVGLIPVSGRADGGAQSRPVAVIDSALLTVACLTRSGSTWLRHHPPSCDEHPERGGS
jgi:hypothetical protein